MIRKAVIPAAGLGTRFLPVTKSMPKEMLPIIDKPIIQFVVEEAIASEIEDIRIITGKGKRAIEDFFDTSSELESHLFQNKKYELLREVRDISSLVDIHYIRQKEKKDVYAYKFRGKRYDAGDKLGYVKAIVDFALERRDLREEIERYIRGIRKGEEV